MSARRGTGPWCTAGRHEVSCSVLSAGQPRRMRTPEDEMLLSRPSLRDLCSSGVCKPSTRRKTCPLLFQPFHQPAFSLLSFALLFFYYLTSTTSLECCWCVPKLHCKRHFFFFCFTDTIKRRKEVQHQCCVTCAISFSSTVFPSPFLSTTPHLSLSFVFFFDLLVAFFLFLSE